MSSYDDDPLPLEGCTLPGTVAVTDDAMSLAKQFAASVPTGYITSFIWMDGRRRKASKDAPWVDEGSGLDLGAYKVAQIPEEAIYRAGLFRYAVLIRDEILAGHPQKMIDLDQGGNPILR